MQPKPARHPELQRVLLPQNGAVSAPALIIGVGLVIGLGGIVLALATRLAGENSPSGTEQATPQTESATQRANARPSVEALTDPQRLRARASAQTQLARYQSAVDQLTERGALSWAKSPFENAKATASEASRAFQDRNFAAAAESYRQAADAAEALIKQIPQRLDTALTAANAAIESADQDRAQSQFELALSLHPEHPEAVKGLQRVAVMDEVQQKLAVARRLRQIDETTGARIALQEALALDPENGAAQDALASLQAQINEQAFSRAMGQALVELDSGHIDGAAQHLARAQQLRPGDSAVKDLAVRINEVRKESRLLGLEQEALALAGEENWAAAVASYESALSIDPNASFANAALGQAKQRASLDAQIEDYLRRPARLQAAAVREQATRSLVRAVSIENKGPKLESQISALRAALKSATTPVPVTFRSDNQTQITIYRIGDQGRFEQRTLELKPGRYTVIGSRSGYRDVRIEIEVQEGMAPVEIRASETL